MNLNELIEKYKLKVDYYSKLDSVNCNIRENVYGEILSDLEQFKDKVESRITYSKQHGEGAFECCVKELKEIIGE